MLEPRLRSYTITSDSLCREVLSDLAREGLRAGRSETQTRNGIPLLEPTADEGIVTPDAVARLLDQP